MRYLYAFNTRMNELVCKVLIVAFSVMVVVVFMQVIFRYVLEHSLEWSEELARYLFIWATFLGASVGFYEQRHIRVTALLKSLRTARQRAAMLVVVDATCIAFLGMYVSEGITVSYRVFMLGQVANSMTWLSIGFVYLAIPVGSFFMLMNVIAYAIINLRVLFSGEESSAPVVAD